MADPDLFFFASPKVYTIAFVVTFYFICSIFASLTVGRPGPELVNPIAVKDNITVRGMLFATIIAAIPYVNIFIALTGVLIMVVNVFVWIVNSLLAPNEFLDKTPFRKEK